MTAVEWYEQEVSRLDLMMAGGSISLGEYVKLKQKALEQAKEMEKERTSKLCYGIWRAFETGCKSIYISNDLSILGYVNPLSEEDMKQMGVKLLIKIE